MKSLFIKICLAFMLNLPVFGQAIYDFSKGDFTTIGRVKEGQTASLKIININTLFYNITIKANKGLLTTPTPAELQTLFRLSNPSEKASEATEGTAQTEGATQKMEKEKDKAVAGSNLLGEMTTLVQLCSTFVIEAKKISFYKLRRAELTNLAKQPWVNHATMAAMVPANLSIRNIQIDISNFSDAYQKAKAQYKIAIDAASGDDKAQKRIEDALRDFEEGYEGIDEENLIKLVDDLAALQIALADPTRFTALTPPIQADNCDLIEYEIIIEPDKLNNRFSSANNASPIFVSIPVYSGWKVDFSTGLNFSFSDGAKDEKYSLENETNGKGTLKKQENENAITTRVVAMLHAYPRSGKNYAAGFMIGVGAGFKEENTLTAAYYLGGSLILGKTQKVMVNLGLSLLPVNRLKSEFHEGNSYSIESTKISDITEKTMRPSIFFGISYAIASRTIIK